MIWAKEETLAREEIEKIQLDRLKETAAYIYEKSAPYRKIGRASCRERV